MSAGSAQDAVRESHERRLEAARAALAELERRDERIANGRLLAFAVAAGVLAAAALTDVVSWAWVALPVAAFVELVRRHARIARERERADRVAAFHEAALRRIAGDWAGRGDPGTAFARPHHPYAEHLDVFGRGSLFEFLCRARTPEGRRTLAEWLCGGAAAADVRARQSAVAELRPRLDLRLDLDLAGHAAAGRGDGAGLEALPAWGESPPEPVSAGLRLAAAAASAALLVPVAGWLAAGWPFWPALLGGAAVLLVQRAGKARVGRVLAVAETPTRDLVLAIELFRRVEREPGDAALLRSVREALHDGELSASQSVSALRRRMDLLDAGRNQFFAPFAWALCYELHVAFAVEAWRRRVGRRLRSWLEAVGRFEALSSLASHAHEHPDDPFPEILDQGPLVEASGLAHPLLPERKGVANDLVLDARRRVYVVSGSNMSGKSTWLRTVGTNVVLAQAGAPVRAARMRLSPCRLGASIHVHDSLLDGESRFYAEVTQVGRVVKLAAPDGPPLLFLLDELFHGTNSTDRRTGAAAVVRELLRGGAVGLLTTHDLELARIAEDLDAGVVNVHFEDRFEDGRMSFDYRLRPGVVTRSNALALMRAVGLDV